MSDRLTSTMRAVVCVEAGGPEVLQVRQVPVPTARDGWSLVRVRGAGLNRSELRTRRGHSPSVRFPRVLGIECVGSVVESWNPRLLPGTTVAAVMGEMGRDFDGGYAEQVLVPDHLLMPIRSSLPWEVLAALPESYLTAQGSLDALGAEVAGAGTRLLIRGGTSSVGLAATTIARAAGLEVLATTRRVQKVGVLRSAGAQHTVVDDGTSLSESVRSIWSGGPDLVLDLVGASSALDSLQLVRRGGTVCVSGSLSGWLIEQFEPIAMIPSGTLLTSFHSKDLSGEAGAGVLQRVVDAVESDRYRPVIDRVVSLDGVAEAHRYMEHDAAAGKVVLVP